MLALGIVLLVIAVAAIIAALVGGSDESVSFDLGLFEIATNTLGAFLIGAATVLLLAIGMALTRMGLSRGRKQRHQRKELDRLKSRDASTAPADRPEAPPS